MCKLAGWTSSKENPLTKAAADAAIQAAHKIISKSERDGFGYAQSGATGLRAKYVQPSEFDNISGLPNFYARAGKAAAGFQTTFRTSQEGMYSPTKHMMVHGRTATCGVSLENVHPFRRNGWTLAHNGVVSWNGPKDKAHEKVTCDSQHLLIAMADHTPTLQRKEALTHIGGYAAFLAFNPQGKLTVAVDDTAKLWAGITKKQRWIFGTTKEIVEAIADAWNCADVTAYPLAEWSWFEFDSKGSEPDLSDWHHGRASDKQLGFASKSLGAGWDKSTYRKKRAAGTTSYGGYGGAGNWHGGYGAAANTSSRDAWLSAREASEQMTDAEAIAAVEAAEAEAAQGIGAWEGGTY